MLFRLYTHWRSSYSGIPLRIWFLSFVSLINRCGAMVVVFLTIYLTQHLGYSIQEAGYVLGCFGAGAFTGAYLGGKLTDRVGYYPIMLWSLILNGLMLMVLMLLTNFWAVCAAMFVMSVISEVFRPANSVAISRYSDPETRTRSISLYRMSVNLGWTVAPAFGGLLAGFGWHWLFVVDGVTCVLAALMLWRFIAPKPPVQAEAGDEELASAGPEPVAALPNASPYRDKPFLAFILLTILNAVVFMQLLWTVPIFFKKGYHWDEHTIGLLAALNGLIVFLVEMPLIYRIEGRRSRLSYVRVGLVLYIAAYFAFLVPPGGMPSALLFMVAISFGEMFVMPFSSNFVFGYAEKGRAGGYMALYTMAYSLANIIAPLLGTQVIALWGFNTLWCLLGGIAAVTWVGFWLLEQKTEAKFTTLTSAAPESEAAV